jgi:hypothetical protein
MDRRYVGGIEPAILDLVEIDTKGISPHQYQPENHLINALCYWKLIRKAAFADAVIALDSLQADLWGLLTDSSYSGQYDRVPLSLAASYGYSLRLIDVSDFRVRVSAEGAIFGNAKRKLRGYFTYCGHEYALSVTDPLVEEIFLAEENGFYNIGRAVLCVSLGEPHDGYAYKLIAGVIQP